MSVAGRADDCQQIDVGAPVYDAPLTTGENRLVKARRKARLAHRRAKQTVSRKRRELQVARRSMQPWCGIAP